MIATIACAGCFAVALAVCVWAYLEGHRRHRRCPAPVARVLVPHHPAWRRAHPRNPGLPVDGRPLDDYEARAFDTITKRRVLVTAAMIVPSGACDGESRAPAGLPRSPGAGAVRPPSHRAGGRQEGCESPGVLGGSPVGSRTSPTPRTEAGVTA